MPDVYKLAKKLWCKQLKRQTVKAFKRLRKEDKLILPIDVQKETDIAWDKVSTMPGAIEGATMMGIERSDIETVIRASARKLKLEIK